MALFCVYITSHYRHTLEISTARRSPWITPTQMVCGIERAEFWICCFQLCSLELVDFPTRKMDGARPFIRGGFWSHTSFSIDVILRFCSTCGHQNILRSHYTQLDREFRGTYSHMQQSIRYESKETPRVCRATSCARLTVVPGAIAPSAKRK